MVFSIDVAGFRDFLTSLFPEPDTFLRELVQNSMEALHAAVMITGDDRKRHIHIEVDANVPSITIRDNGCGMTQQELTEKLATVFRSGWSEGEYDNLGVGQFGFGFFSTMLVSDRVEVRTRSLSCEGQDTIWRLDCRNGTSDMQEDLSEQYGHGFSVELFLSEGFRHFASSSYISETLQDYLLFCPFRIYVSGAPLDVPTRAQWQRSLSDARGVGDVIEDMQSAFGWEEAPLAFKTSDIGVLCVAPSEERSAPATKIYRHGVFVLEAEIIPQPLNYIFCGVFNVDDLNIRPDRKSYQDDSAATAFQARILEQVALLFMELSEDPRRSVSFFEGWLDPMIAGVMTHDTLSDLRKEMPLRYVTERGISLALETTWRHLTRELSSGRVLFTRDPVSDRAMLDHFRDSGETIVALMNPAEHALASNCARESDIRLVSVSDCYLERQRRLSESHPQLVTLFSEARSGNDYSFVCVRDDDARVPLKLMRESSEHEEFKEFLKMLGEAVGREVPENLIGDESWIVLINLAHPAIDVLSIGLEGKANRSNLRNGAELLLLSARMAAGDALSSEEQIAHATALGDLMADAFAIKRTSRWRLF